MAPTANLQPLNFSKTQRIVFLIDLHPLLTLQNSSPYIAAVTATVQRLLRFPPLSAALFAFKFFFSSLSPRRSAAVLPRHLSNPSLSFDLAPETLASLSTTLNSNFKLTDLPSIPSSVRASYAESSLLQLTHHYAWEIEKDNVLGEDTSIDGDFIRIPSNLVILLSPISRSVNCLVDYLELREFDDVFRDVREAFVARDIHLCWIDVKADTLEIEGANENKSECGDTLATLEEDIKKMGWSFCSSNLIVLGSALLPLGLIYPKIGMCLDFVDFGGLDKKNYSGELSLEILDVNGLPLEYRCCNLEFVNLKIKNLPCTIETYDILNAEESRDSQSLLHKDAFSVRLGQGNVKVHVKSVHPCGGCEKIGGFSDIVLVREGSQECGNKRKKSDDVFFADRVLHIVHGEMGKVTWTNEIPAWQIFLSFLHTKGYWALVSLSSSDGNRLMGRLKPFTAHLAILYICDAGHGMIRDKSGPNGNMHDTFFDDSNNSNSRGSQTDTSTSGNYEWYGDGKRKRSQRKLYKEMAWSSLCKAAFEGLNFDIFELYIAKYLEKSKKLKFLKCWMKQIIKVDQCFLTSSVAKSMEEKIACNELSSKPSPAKDSAMSVLKSETSEAFFKNLSDRIQHGLESGMDLQHLAERVVKSSIHWLRHNCEDKNNYGGQESTRSTDNSCSEVVGKKLIKLLLKAPKEMKKIHQESPSEHVVREYEMQIFLRLEILQSDISATIGESSGQKLLKQTCSLLEILQYLVAGGIHGHVSLYDYVERTIKSRYSAELGDVVKEIYTRMDLLPFEDNDETPNLLLNSEDSNQSWRDKHDRNGNCSVSNEGESSQPPSNAFEEIEKDERERILNEARERRERAARFALGRTKDLQRVWAPTHPKSTKCKFDSLPKKSKRKRRETPSYTVVYETPLKEDNRACLGENNKDKSVSKALFQDN